MWGCQQQTSLGMSWYMEAWNSWTLFNFLSASWEATNRYHKSLMRHSPIIYSMSMCETYACWGTRHNETMIFHLITFGNPPMPSARSSFKEPVDITGPRLELKNRFKDNIDSLPKSLASCESARRRALSFSIILASSRGSSSNSETSTESKKWSHRWKSDHYWS